MNLVSRAAFSCFLLSPMGLVLAAAPPGHERVLIDAAKAAMGGSAWDHQLLWHETGAVTSGGLRGHYESWLSLGSLHATSHFELGPVSGGSGWDGHQAWTTDTSREVRIETSGEAVAQAIQDAYRSGYAFFFPDRFPALITDAGTRAADGVSYAIVKVTPTGAEPFEVWFDPKTHLIVREVQLTGAQPQTFLFSDFARFDGILAPKKTITRVGNDPKYDTVTVAAGIGFGEPAITNRFAPPPPPVNSAQWPAGQDAVTVPIRLLNNHIYVDASINGGAPLPFVFDTGATDILDMAAAKKLGIPVEGKLAGGGYGDKIEDFGFAKVKRVSLGGLALPDQVFGTWDSGSWSAIEGAESAGLLGYEFVKRAVLSIDYAGRRMAFTKQSAFHPPAGAVAIPFTFDSHVPMVHGTIDGVEGEFEIDTGSRGALSLMIPFAREHGLIAKYHATRVATVGFGVGGPSKALLARAGQLRLGSVTVDAPVTDIATDKGGAAVSARTAGNIGGDLLKRFTLTLDYQHHLLWLQPNALAAEREVFDRSGLWISRAKDGGISVADVSTGSAAAAIGIVAGDAIVSVNGKPARGIELYDLREQFKGAIGTAFKLRVRGKSGERSVALELAEQI